MSTVLAQAASTPTENLTGLVEHVTSHNEENGFCVLRLKARGQRDFVTVIGHATMISAGEWIHDLHRPGMTLACGVQQRVWAARDRTSQGGTREHHEAGP